MESAKPQPKSTKSIKNTKTAKKPLSTLSNKSKPDPHIEDQNNPIAVSAYYKAQARGFEPGNELADWLAAEAEVNQ